MTERDGGATFRGQIRRRAIVFLTSARQKNSIRREMCSPARRPGGASLQLPIEMHPLAAFEEGHLFAAL